MIVDSIIDSIVDLETDLYYNRHPNLKSELKLLTTIWFEMANRPSLTHTHAHISLLSLSVSSLFSYLHNFNVSFPSCFNLSSFYVMCILSSSIFSLAVSFSHLIFCMCHPHSTQNNNQFPYSSILDWLKKLIFTK